MRPSLAFASATSMLALLFAVPAHAGIVNKINSQNAATACTLSIPTTDTKVRPKALGFRNEGTVISFVICGFDIDSSEAGFHQISLSFLSIDNHAHTFNCTAASRYNAEPATQYLTRAVTVPVGTTATSFLISDTDPDYDESIYDLYPWGQSITCQLPPGVAIVAVESSHDDDDSAP